MRQGVRTIFATAVAIVLLSGGAAFGAAGQPLVLGQANTSGAAKTSLSSTATSGSVFGVTGKTSGAIVRAANSGTGTSVTGVSTGSGSTSVGLSGTSTNGDGVQGTTTNGDAGVSGTALNVGVKGVSSTSSGIGVYGQDTASGTGVSGTSAGGDGLSGAGGTDGVVGTTTSGTGVHGTSSNGVGVIGTSTTADGTQGNTNANGASGVYGQNFGTGNGVAGRADNGVGVLGASTNNWAMQATGPVTQSLGDGGWIKAMVYVSSTGAINRCFNSQETGSLVHSNGCGITVTPNINGCACHFRVDTGFDMTARFETVTTFTAAGVPAFGDLSPDANSTAVDVITTRYDGVSSAAAFMIIVY